MSSNAPIPDVAQALINWDVHGRLVQNQLFFHHWTGPIDAAALDLLRDRLHFSFRFNFLGGLGQGTLLRSIECIDRTTGGVPPTSVIINKPALSSISAAASSIALALIQSINLPPEPHPCRAFITGIRRDQITGNFINASSAESLRALWATNNASHAPFGWRHVCVSLFAGGVARPVGVFQQINHYTIRSLRVSQQQRRDAGAP